MIEAAIHHQTLKSLSEAAARNYLLFLLNRLLKNFFLLSPPFFAIDITSH